MNTWSGEHDENQPKRQRITSEISISDLNENLTDTKQISSMGFILHYCNTRPCKDENCAYNEEKYSHKIVVQSDINVFTYQNSVSHDHSLNLLEHYALSESILAQAKNSNGSI